MSAVGKQNLWYFFAVVVIVKKDKKDVVRKKKVGQCGCLLVFLDN